MAKYGFPRVTKEVEEAYNSFLSHVHDDNVIPMNVRRYNDGSISMTVFVFDTTDGNYALERVKDSLKARNVPYDELEVGEIDERVARGDTPIFVHHYD